MQLFKIVGDGIVLVWIIFQFHLPDCIENFLGQVQIAVDSSALGGEDADLGQLLYV